MYRTLEHLAAAFALAGGVILLLIVAVTVVNAGAFGLDKLARLAGGTVAGLPGYEDFVRLAVAVASPLFLPYCQLRRGHIAVDLFTAGAGPRVNRAIDGLCLLLMAVAALFLAYWMVLGMLETRADGALSRVLGWPVWPFYLGGIAALPLWALLALAQFAAGSDGSGDGVRNRRVDGDRAQVDATNGAAGRG